MSEAFTRDQWGSFSKVESVCAGCVHARKGKPGKECLTVPWSQVVKDERVATFRWGPNSGVEEIVEILNASAGLPVSLALSTLENVYGRGLCGIEESRLGRKKLLFAPKRVSPK